MLVAPNAGDGHERRIVERKAMLGLRRLAAGELKERRSGDEASIAVCEAAKRV
jgi:hypothetical protein